jgi:hypothetical protein
MFKKSRHQVEMPVETWLALFSGFIERNRKIWVHLGRLESTYIYDRLADIDITAPVYICGLARGGSTILLECLVSHNMTASHCYKDFPFVYTPYWWNRYLDCVPQKKELFSERAHKDRIFVTSDSPEAMEEILWFTFFPDSLDPKKNSVLDESVENSAFETFYRNHIKKILLIRDGKRYVAKGNYNITRIQYIHKLFPDVRFIVPIREPFAHVASLLKQHRLFCNEEKRNPRALEHMRRTGHFEFGLDRRPINTGNCSQTAKTIRLWELGKDAHGYANEWRSVYGFLADLLERNEALKDVITVVKYEELCLQTRNVLINLFQKTSLPNAGEVINTYSEKISAPTYYQPDLAGDEKRIIADETAEVAARFGYQ